MHRKKHFSALATSFAALLAWTNANADDDAAVIPPVSIKEIMVGAIEPASNALWAIAMDENAPESDAEWLAVENEAIQLLAASSAISLGGSGDNDRKLAGQAQWLEYTRQMTEIGLMILEAARERDYYATLDAGNLLVEPCGACHSAFPVDSR